MAHDRRPKRLILLGATGSIGQNCLDVVRRHPERFQVVGLATRSRVEALLAAAGEFRPEVVAIADRTAAEAAGHRFSELGIAVLSGPESLTELATWPEADLVVNGLVGAVGLPPTYYAVRMGRSVALANKESLVVGGGLITSTARATGAAIVPIDSEHSAIFQCLQGEEPQGIRRLLLTGSGGPFRTWPRERIAKATVEEALAHPNWVMGPKITVDSATLMNKGLEVIEAHWLFGLPVDQIEVVIHPQSIVHSMVEFVDGSVKAQLGMPDMRIPIQYALSYPERLESDFPRVDFFAVGHLDFEPPDFQRFPALALAYQSARAGGTSPAVLNAANEVAVHAFLEGRIPFGRIPEIIEGTLAAHKQSSGAELSELLEVDRWARQQAEQMIRKF
ncbi:MAG: 1-deoxy-D-xylulose-5-phosphate reductoisomerase [candidate division KSB1 bacterium]|nr:1-deoxy-D-xylulose-5-phosphate reductoisomerase [candidate division KSB1 bacterium]